MSVKNDFHYLAFLNADGLAEVTAAQLLKSFEQDLAMFLMDYASPHGAFSGRVTANVMDTRALWGAIAAFELLAVMGARIL